MDEYQSLLQSLKTLGNQTFPNERTMKRRIRQAAKALEELLYMHQLDLTEISMLRREIERSENARHKT